MNPIRCLQCDRALLTALEFHDIMVKYRRLNTTTPIRQICRSCGAWMLIDAAGNRHKHIPSEQEKLHYEASRRILTASQN